MTDTTKSLTPAQQKLLDAITNGAKLVQSPQATTKFLQIGSTFTSVNWRTAQALIDRKLIDQLPHQPGRNYYWDVVDRQ